MTKNLLDTLATNFQCKKKIHTMQIDMMGAKMENIGGQENLGSLELDYFYISNISNIKTELRPKVSLNAITLIL